MLRPAGAIDEGHRAVSETTEWAIPEAARPKAAECAFDLERALSSVLALRSEVPEDAFTASILGTERAGNGVLIREDGLVLTIGYLITEAANIWLTTIDGRAVAAHPHSGVYTHRSPEARDTSKPARNPRHRPPSTSATPDPRSRMTFSWGP